MDLARRISKMIEQEARLLGHDIYLLRTY